MQLEIRETFEGSFNVARAYFKGHKIAEAVSTSFQGSARARQQCEDQVAEMMGGHDILHRVLRGGVS